MDICESFSNLRGQATGGYTFHLYMICIHSLQHLDTDNMQKSVYVYLKFRPDLPETHPDVHKKFGIGYYLVTPSNKHWAGMFTDFMIEQVLVRSVKMNGHIEFFLQNLNAGASMCKHGYHAKVGVLYIINTKLPQR